MIVDLVQAACGGDPAAIEQLLRESQPSITRFARRYCATPQDVEDAVQETLWIVYRRIGALRVARAFVSWMFRIVRHECLRLFEHHGNEPVTLDVSLLDALEYTPNDSELRADLQRDLIAAIAGLPAHYREVLIRRDLEGLTAPETAEALGITVEAVKARLHRARAHLRDTLAHWGG